ncbi:MAG TPA: DUF4124 domain-containing protein [Chiayiivirga sp.]|nr:DUF4124 domain-containing protein [Chiayiivirga sp.]
MRITLLFATLALAGATLDATAGGEVYRWTDEKGIAHYTDTPPASGKYERVNVRTGGASAEAQAKDEASTDAAAADSSAKKTPAQERAERCKAARANLAALHSSLEVSIEENGKPRALTEEERLEHADRSERIIASDCDTP